MTAEKPFYTIAVPPDTGMTRVAAVVTRQYGGVKLGIRGLIQAYSDTVEAGLAAAEIVRLIRADRVRVQIPYDCNDLLLSQARRFNAIVSHTDYGEWIIHEFLVEKHQAPDFIRMLSQFKTHGLKVLVKSD